MGVWGVGGNSGRDLFADYSGVLYQSDLEEEGGWSMRTVVLEPIMMRKDRTET